MAAALSIVRKPSSDTVEALEELLAQAKRGELLGCICIPVYQQRKYLLFSTGVAAENLTWTAGALGACTAIANDRAIEESIEPDD